MVGIEIFVEHVGAGAVDQHQLAKLLQLVLGREGGNEYHGGVFFVHLDGTDDKVLRDLRQTFVIPHRFKCGQLQLGILPLDTCFQHPEGGVARIAKQ